MAPSFAALACLLALARAERAEHTQVCNPTQLQMALRGHFFLRSPLQPEQGFGLQEWLADDSLTGRRVHLRFMVGGNSMQCWILTRFQAGLVYGFEKSCEVLEAVEGACKADLSLCPYAEHFPKCIARSGLGTMAAGSQQPVFVAFEAPPGGGEVKLGEWLGQGRTSVEIADVARQLLEALALLQRLNWVSIGLHDPSNVRMTGTGKLWLPNLLDPKPSITTPRPHFQKLWGYDMQSAGMLLDYMFTENKKSKVNIKVMVVGAFRHVAQIEDKDIQAIAKDCKSQVPAHELLAKHFGVEVPQSLRLPQPAGSSK